MTTSLTLKFFMDKNSGKILYAEAGKDFVDFLFNLLTLPLGSVTRLLENEDTLGCLKTLYTSVQDLSDEYIQPDQDKSHLLQPQILSPLTGPNPPLLLQSYTQFYSCGNNHGSSSNIAYVTDIKDKACPQCGQSMSAAVSYVGSKSGSVSSSGESGYVKGSLTYMVTDDLMVTPLSTMSTDALSNKFNVGDVTALENLEVNVNMELGLALLKASLRSKTVLNDVFPIPMLLAAAAIGELFQRTCVIL